jgi:hypothetical protein
MYTMYVFHITFCVIFDIHTIKNEITIYNHNSFQHSIVLMNNLEKTSTCI